MSKVEQIMEQAQVFASAWSLVGGRFDNGNMLTEAEEAKAELRQMVEALAQPAGEAEPVAYLDIGTGYIDLGSDLSSRELEALPKGRHMLVIAGSYGIDGYTTTQQSQPLAYEQRRDIILQAVNVGHAIDLTEAAHNIKGVTE